jgi:hypothetical protein
VEIVAEVVDGDGEMVDDKNSEILNKVQLLSKLCSVRPFFHQKSS